MIDGVHPDLIEFHGLVSCPPLAFLLKEFAQLSRLIRTKLALKEKLESSQVIEAAHSLLIIELFAVVTRDWQGSKFPSVRLHLYWYWLAFCQCMRQVFRWGHFVVFDILSIL